MKIFVDADACPVTESIITVAEQENLPVTLVKNFAHFSDKDQPAHVETIYVDKGSDIADFRIIQLAKKGDLVITQDYGLASLCLGKGCIPIHHKGFIYTHENIDRLLMSRHMSAKARKSGQRTKGPKAFTEEDEQKFCQLLRKTIAQMKSDK
ncbi:YaiI/YqxD family protein [Virgibacillus sp. W0181]|uniref:YaiI/YqxD family protein n=1 Tax=Virgibacillus sp. W0181 TaxID=3391581 RepID=UPI003F489124